MLRLHCVSSCARSSTFPLPLCDSASRALRGDMKVLVLSHCDDMIGEEARYCLDDAKKEVLYLFNSGPWSPPKKCVT